VIIILTEAGEGIGYGHLTRMTALAECLLESREQVRILIEWHGQRVCPDQLLSTFTVFHPWWANPTEAALCHKADTVIVDSYRSPRETYNALFNRFRIVAVDDYHRLDYPVHMVINPNPYGDASCYQPTALSALAGPEYVILRKAFRLRKGLFQVRDRLTHVVIALGGDDPLSLGIQLGVCVASSGYNVTLVGPYSSPPTVPSGLLSVSPVRSPLDLAELFLSADVVVSGGGQTLHELACLGVPTIAIECGADQARNLDYYAAQGFIDIPPHTDQSQGIDEFVLCRLQHMTSRDIRVQAALRARNGVAASGVMNIVHAIVGNPQQASLGAPR